MSCLVHHGIYCREWLESHDYKDDFLEEFQENTFNDLNYERENIKITKMKYVQSPNNDFNGRYYYMAEFTIMIDLGRFWITYPVKVNFIFEIDAETGDDRIFVGMADYQMENIIDMSILEDLSYIDLELTPREIERNVFSITITD